MQKTFLYRARDHEGALLYVGITSMPKVRQATHANYAPWRALSMGELEWQEFATREDAAEAERREIAEHRPPFNTRGNPDKWNQIENQVRINFLVPAETRVAWKKLAIDHGVTMQQLIQDSVNAYSKRTEP